MTTETGCHAARTGEGYWTCDVPGGCSDCRTLAAELHDTDTLDAWKAETAFLGANERGDVYHVTTLGNPVPEDVVAHYAAIFPDTIYFEAPLPQPREDQP